jgi:3-deoxy-manno-octulosonate cytidylyltransferase (CMP-KDO synthetase)
MKSKSPRLRLCCRSFIVIPARLHSTRLPEKLLLRETGKSVLEHTYQAARDARKPLGIRVATDSDQIAAEVERFGGVAVMTSSHCASGTDRVAEVAHQLSGADVIVNVQADEPDITGEAIDLAVSLLEENPGAAMATLAAPLRSREQLDNPNCVKVVFDSQGQALYFSRSPIPHVREWDDTLLSADPPLFYQHIGLYAYRRQFLLNLAQMPRCPLEKAESLEQLRVLHRGEIILVGRIDQPTCGIDTAEDYEAFVARRRAG